MKMGVYLVGYCSVFRRIWWVFWRLLIEVKVVVEDWRVMFLREVGVKFFRVEVKFVWERWMVVRFGLGMLEDREEVMEWERVLLWVWEMRRMRLLGM